jgi:hypothetical protein
VPYPRCRAFLQTALVALVGITQPLFAQEETGVGSIGTWLANQHIAIRQSFDGASTEAKPAALTWVNHDSKLGGDYYLVDLGAQYKAPELVPCANCSLVLLPTLEWHRDTTTKTPTNIVCPKLNLEFRPARVAAGPADEPGGHTIVPFFLLSGSASRDFKQLTTKGNLSLRTSLFGIKNWLPGSELTTGDEKTYRGQYYPYLGVDWIDPVPGKTGTHFWSGIARFYAEYAPLAKGNTQYLQVLLDYTYRRKLRGDPSVGKNLPLFIVGLNLFLDAKNRVAVGYQYQRGYDAKDDFAFHEKSSIGIKIKI